MREFFKGWRRKAGFGVLVLAMMVYSAWIRTLYACDTLTIPMPARTQFLISGRGGFVWGSFDVYESFEWQRLGPDRFPDLPEFMEDLRQTLSRYDLRMWSLMYVHLAVPLTVLSACLILWPRRKLPSIGGQPDA